MNRTGTRLVTKENGPSPAGKPDECCYCKMPIGVQHETDCVLRIRTVMVRMAAEYPISVPESWSAEQIERHRNEGSWCSGNALDELREICGEGACICWLTEFEYIREATKEEDEMVP